MLHKKQARQNVKKHKKKNKMLHKKKARQKVNKHKKEKHNAKTNKWEQQKIAKTKGY